MIRRAVKRLIEPRSGRQREQTRGWGSARARHGPCAGLGRLPRV